MVPAVLQDMMGENTLSLDDIDFSAITTVGRLFKIFIEFEKETIEFYEMLELFIEDAAVIEGLNTIIREEKKHVRALNSRLESYSNRTIQPS
jgi:rubrerythrin